MQTPFVLEVEALQPDTARRLAEALATELHARRTGIRRDGRILMEGEPMVDVDVGRGTPAAPTLRVGVRSPDGPPMWLKPLALPDDESAALHDALDFLERWGFVPALPANAAADAGSDADASTRSVPPSAV